ncbi:MAG TPA: hypothetical protein VGK54_04250 [Chloroflexota bacterium]
MNRDFGPFCQSQSGRCFGTTPGSVSWDADADLITGRVLAAGRGKRLSGCAAQIQQIRH